MDQMYIKGEEHSIVLWLWHRRQVHRAS